MTAPLRFAMLVICLAGCASPANYSHAPAPVNYPSEVQHKMQAVAHWHAEAEALSADIVARMSRDPMLWAAPLFIDAPARASEFELALARMLASDLVAAGMAVAVGRNGGYPVNLEARLIEFGSYRYARPPLSGGKDRARLDAAGVPRSEVLITVTVAHDNRYLFRTTQVLYVRDADRHLYARLPASQRLIDLVREREARRGPFNP